MVPHIFDGYVFRHSIEGNLRIVRKSAFHLFIHYERSKCISSYHNENSVNEVARAIVYRIYINVCVPMKFSVLFKKLLP